MKKILIVEDELAYVHLLRNKLRPDYQILHAQDGRIGLAKAKSEKPDLILLDIVMPAMDGLTALNELRKDTWGKTAKVILLTNLEANDRIVMKVSEDLPTYYCIKSDVTLDDLLDKIKELLEEQDRSRTTIESPNF
jgi:DNA-binding response OmpR family regulator